MSAINLTIYIGTGLNHNRLWPKIADKGFVCCFVGDSSIVLRKSVFNLNLCAPFTNCYRVTMLPYLTCMQCLKCNIFMIPICIVCMVGQWLVIFTHIASHYDS